MINSLTGVRTQGGRGGNAGWTLAVWRESGSSGHTPTGRLGAGSQAWKVGEQGSQSFAVSETDKDRGTRNRVVTRDSRTEVISLLAWLTMSALYVQTMAGCSVLTIRDKKLSRCSLSWIISDMEGSVSWVILPVISTRPNHRIDLLI